MRNFKKSVVRLVCSLVIVSSCAIAVLAVGFREVFMETTFQTGEVKIDLNHGKPIFEGSDFNIEPNQTLVREFTVQNVGTAECYYTIYLEDVKGALADEIVFEVYDAEQTLIKQACPSNFTKNDAIELNEILAPQQEVRFCIHAYLPMQSGNEYQTQSLSFDVATEAIQSKNYKG